MSRKADESEKLANAVDTTIMGAKIMKEATQVSPFLAPLKAVAVELIRVLEAVQAERMQKRHQDLLRQCIQQRIKELTELESSDGLRDLANTYRGRLQEILEKMDISPIPKSKRKWRKISAKSGEDIKSIDQELRYWYDDFMMKLAQRTIEVNRVNEEYSAIRSLKTVSANGDIHGICMEGTRLQILQEINEWKHANDAPQILWLCDVAGAGKSTVAKQLVEAWKEESGFAGCFFFSRDVEETQTAKYFFSTIAQQGVSRLSSKTQTAVVKGIHKISDPVSATLEEQCCAIFTEPLEAFEQPTILVLDAFDECEPHTGQKLLGILLQQLTHLPHLKLFVASRPEPHIEGLLLKDHSPQRMSLREDRASNCHDVECYMRQQLHDQGLEGEQIDALITRADGLFIWASTVCSLFQEPCDPTELLHVILSQSIPKMDTIYHIVLSRALGKDPVETCEAAYFNVLKLIVVAYIPISPNTVDDLLEARYSMKVVSRLGSVLECRGPDQPIRFLHSTFREFLLTEEIDFARAHYFMSKKCLTVMKKHLEYDTYRLLDCVYRKKGPRKIDLSRLSPVTIGTQKNWSSDVVVKTHKIKVFRCSQFDAVAAAGGSEDGVAIVSLWSLDSADGVTSPHPCGTRDCEVIHVSFHEGNELRTGCACGWLYIWEISNNHLEMSENPPWSTGREVQLWADDGNKALSMILVDTEYPLGSPRRCCISVRGLSDMTQELGTIPGFITNKRGIATFHGCIWIFSPQGGHSIAYWGSEIRVWDTLSGQKLFSRSPPIKSCDLLSLHFSPDAQYIIYGSRTSICFMSAKTGDLVWKKPLLNITGHNFGYRSEQDEEWAATDEGSGLGSSNDLSADHEAKIPPDSVLLSILSTSTADLLSPTYFNGYGLFARYKDSEKKGIGAIIREYINRGAIQLESTGIREVEDYTDKSSVLPIFTSDSITFRFPQSNQEHNECVTGELPEVSKFSLSSDGLYLLTTHTQRGIGRKCSSDAAALAATLTAVWAAVLASIAELMGTGDVALTIANLFFNTLHFFQVPRHDTNTYNQAYLQGSNLKRPVRVESECPFKLEEDHYIEFAPDSSTAIIWDAHRLYFVDMETARSTSPPISGKLVMELPDVFALFHHATKSNKLVYLHQNDSYPDFDSSFVGFGFGSNGCSICAATTGFWEEGGIIVSSVFHVKISDDSPQLNGVSGPLPRPDEAPISSQTIRVNEQNIFSLMFDPEHDRTAPLFWNPSNGKGVNVAALYMMGNQLHYGKYMILGLPDVDEIPRPMVTGTNRIAYLNNKGKVVVIDCSLLIENV
ncbi:15389_t:CDS:2 [Acaulospora colombiana]|uniref:15389_t:CDS:1 n=1 Tax=Acaulospora colombiana TaxID=27376 RepID=A0ACA9LSP4_9GLOM|nr:15389_t:CDS:2 [Acaulospora colombiana]